jgi:hypothetical protein
MRIPLDARAGTLPLSIRVGDAESPANAALVVR